MKTPFDEDNGLEYYKENIKVSCPYCQSNDLELDDYHCGMPPMTNTLYVTWVCEDCLGIFRTEHMINDEGLLEEVSE